MVLCKPCVGSHASASVLASDVEICAEVVLGLAGGVAATSSGIGEVFFVRQQ